MDSFRDLYNNMLKKRGGNVSDGTLTTTHKYIERHLKDDPTYRTGFKLDKEGNKPIGFRISNSLGSGNLDRNIDVKKMIFKPKENIFSGDYIIEDINYWLVTDCEHNNITPKSISYNCNNSLRLKGNDNVIDVYGYFIKGKFSTDDGRLIKTNDNELTCLIGTYYTDIISKYFRVGESRFIVNGNAFKIDGIDNVTVINKGRGVYTVYLKSDEIHPLDDLENSIAYNEIELKPTDEYIIKGNDKIKKGNEEVFVISPIKTDILFKLDNWTIDNNLAEIISQGNGEVVIKGLVSNEQIILMAYDNDVKICTKTIGIVR